MVRAGREKNQFLHAAGAPARGAADRAPCGTQKLVRTTGTRVTNGRSEATIFAEVTIGCTGYSEYGQTSTLRNHGFRESLGFLNIDLNFKKYVARFESLR